ncbi:MAG: metallophosphoesterase [Candidatus Bathyarchaeia archaeon]
MIKNLVKSNILAFSDFHGSDVAFNKALTAILKHKPKLIMIAGDIADNNFEKAKDFLSRLNNFRTEVFYVPGNMDSKKLIIEGLNLNHVKNIHKKIIDHEDFKIVGFGGSNKTPFNTPIEFNDIEIESFLSSLSFDKKEKIILLTHSPPKNTKIDKTFMKIHAGSIAIRNFIEKNKPILAVCGHIHEACGVDKLGDSLIVNVSSAKYGRYGLIDINNGVNVELLEH